MQKLLTHWKFFLDSILLIGIYIGGVFAFNAIFTYIITIIGASLAGSAALAYFKRDRDYKEIFYKTAISSICGLVVGSFFIEYYAIEKLSYIIMIYFLSSLLSLPILKALANLTETNAAGFVGLLLSKYANVNVKQTETTETKEVVTETKITK